MKNTLLQFLNKIPFLMLLELNYSSNKPETTSMEIAWLVRLTLIIFTLPFHQKFCGDN